jgi:hypothetical protein
MHMSAVESSEETMLITDFDDSHGAAIKSLSITIFA